MPRLLLWAIRGALSVAPWLVVGCALDVNGTGAVETTSDGAASGSIADTDASDTSPPIPIADGAMDSIDAPALHDTAPPDEASEGAADGAPCASGDPSCLVIPPGWSVVAFSTARARACPLGFDAASTDVVESPDLTNACACDVCSVTADPSCNTGTVQVVYGSTPVVDTPQCSTPAPSNLTLDPNGNCSPYSASAGPGGFDDVEYNPPAAVGGTCSAPGDPKPANVTYAAEERVCSATAAQVAACSGGTPCAPQVGNGYSACIMMAGPPVACPNSLFSTPHFIGTSVDFSCSDCGCAVTADCTGTLALFTDGQCQREVDTARADGTCEFTVIQLGGGASYFYVPDPPNNVTCTAPGTSAASQTALVNAATVCCAQ